MLETLILLGLASATVSVTVAQSRLFKEPRALVARWWAWGGELISCPYCLGHWVAALLTILWWPLLGALDRESPAYVVGFLVVLITKWLAITAVSALVSGLIGRLYVSTEA